MQSFAISYWLPNLQHVIEDEERKGVPASAAGVAQLCDVSAAHVRAVRRH